MSEIWLKFIGSVTVEQAVPLIILLFQFFLLLVILVKAQTRDDFDVAGFLRDENGKESSGRAYGFICLAISSWVMASLTFMKLISHEYLWAFMLVFAGTPVLMELAKRWNGILPWTGGNGPSFPQQQITQQTTTQQTTQVTPVPTNTVTGNEP